jgi:magnesium transporter
MKQRCLATSADGRLEELSPDAIQASLSDGEGCVWVDVEDFLQDELVALLTSLGLSSGAVRAFAEAEGRTRVSVFDRELFFELPALAADAGSERVGVAFLCTQNLCVTMHRGPVAALTKTAGALTRDVELSEASTAQLASSLLAGLLEPIIEGVGAIRTRVLELQDQMDRDPGGLDLGEILDYASSIRSLDAITSEHLACFAKLKLMESPVLDIAGSSVLRAVASDAQYLDRVGARLEKRLNNLRDQYSMNQQDRTNQRLAVLTVISAIFLPMTLLAGIYGMNFEVMPELHFRYAYPAVLVLMVAVAAGMILYFRSRGWFK